MTNNELHFCIDAPISADMVLVFASLPESGCFPLPFLQVGGPDPFASDVDKETRSEREATGGRLRGARTDLGDFHGEAPCSEERIKARADWDGFAGIQTLATHRCGWLSASESVKRGREVSANANAKARVRVRVRVRVRANGEGENDDDDDGDGDDGDDGDGDGDVYHDDGGDGDHV
jgi:hypothetical protein